MDSLILGNGRKGVLVRGRMAVPVPGGGRNERNKTDIAMFGSDQDSGSKINIAVFGS